MKAFVFCIMALFLSTGAQAHPHRHYSVASSATQLPHPSGCPRSAFCGCGASVEVFGHSVRDLWPAAAWFRFPRAAAGPGMVAVRSHHVFVIRAVLGNGRVIAYDANSGHGMTRVHEVSLAGYSIRNPRGGHG
jgi:hypothetical protein